MLLMNASIHLCGEETNKKLEYAGVLPIGDTWRRCCDVADIRNHFPNLSPKALNQGGKTQNLYPRKSNSVNESTVIIDTVQN